MSETENYFSAALRLLKAYDGGNEQVTGRTLISLLTILERNETQHARDFAALDALTRRLTSVVAQIAENSISEEDRDLKGALAQLETQFGALSTQDPDARDGEENSANVPSLFDHVRSERGSMPAPAAERASEHRDDAMPRKRSFSEAVADISRRRSLQEAPAMTEASAESDRAEHSILVEAPSSLVERVPENALSGESDGFEGADGDALRSMVGRLDRLTTQLARSERVLASLPALVDSVQGLIDEFDAPPPEPESPYANATGRVGSGQGRSPSNPVGPVASAHEDGSTPEASTHRDAGRDSSQRGPVPRPGRMTEIPGPQPVRQGKRGSHARVAGGMRAAVEELRPARLLSRAGNQFGKRPWRGVASACALFVAANVAMAVQGASSGVERSPPADDLMRQAGPAMHTAAVTSQAVASADLLSGEQTVRVPAKLLLPGLAERLGTSTMRRKVILDDSSAPDGAQAAAQYQLGLRYLEGRAVPQDFKQAACFFEHAAAEGSTPAQYRLAVMLERGVGPAKDVARARKLYRRAAEAGNAHAMHNLAVLLAQDKKGGGAEDAAFWFERAARFGVVDSQFNLGMLYAQGLGVTRSALRAAEWFGIAAAGGDGEASRKHDEVAAGLGAADLAEAKRFVAAFQPLNAVSEANGGAAETGGNDPAKARHDKATSGLAATCPVPLDQHLRYSMR